MKALNRRSVIVIAMALLMLISMGIIYYEAVISTISAVKDHRLWDFGTICEGKCACLNSAYFMGSIILQWIVTEVSSHQQLTSCTRM